jgi:hypothetical protein
MMRLLLLVPAYSGPQTGMGCTCMPSSKRTTVDTLFALNEEVDPLYSDGEYMKSLERR